MSYKNEAERDCYSSMTDWCPGGGILERAKANGQSFAKALTNEHQRDRDRNNLVACRDHNDEIARASARGYAPMKTSGPSKALLGERRAFERMSFRDPAPWNKFEQRVQWVPVKPMVREVEQPAAVTHVIIRYGPSAQIAEHTRMYGFDDFLEAYEHYAAIVTYDPCWAWLIKDAEQYVVGYGFATRHVRIPSWREITIPKSLRTPPRKRR